jgi:hypothetical protein
MIRVRPITTWVISSDRAVQRPHLLQHPVTCLAFTDLRGQVMQPYLTATATGVSNPNPSPQAYNAILASVLREQNYSFWSAEQDNQSRCQALWNLFGHGDEMGHRCAPDGGLPHLRQYRHILNRATLRKLPTNIISQLRVLAERADGQWQVLTTSCWTTGLFFSMRQPNDGGFLYQFLPSAAGPPTAAAASSSASRTGAIARRTALRRLRPGDL